MKKVRKLVKKRAKKYSDHQRGEVLRGDASRVFFKNLKAYSSKERAPVFDVRSIFEQGMSDEEIAKSLVGHFNSISCKFDGLYLSAIPSTYSCPIPWLNETQVAQRLVKFQKPKSMVKHYIFPALVNDAATYLTGLLTHIYNTITGTNTWPLKWKEEFVTLYLRKQSPKERPT